MTQRALVSLLIGAAVLAVLQFVGPGAAPREPEVASAAQGRSTPVARVEARLGGARLEPLVGGPAQEARAPVEAQAEPAAASAAPGVRGRVIDVRTGEGVGGCTVMLSLPGEGREQLVTEPDGEFAFEVDPTGVGIFARAPKGWRWRNGGSQYQWLDGVSRSEDGGLVLELAETRTAPVRGVAVDARTGEPLPHFRFSFRSGSFFRASEPVEVLTRADGTFVSEPVSGGPLRIPKTPRAAAVVSEFDHLAQDEDDEPLRLEFALARQIELELVGEVPADVSKLEVQAVVAAAADASRHAISTSFRTLVKAPVESLPDGRLRVPLHEQGLRPGQDCLLVVTDDQGYWFGSSPYRWEGNPAPVRISMEHTAALSIDWERVLPAGAGRTFYASSSYPTLSLRSQGSQVAQDAPMWAWRQEQRHWLPPGRYELSAVSRCFQSIHEELELAAGETSALVLELVPETDTRTVVGEVRCEAGARLGWIAVTLELLEPGAGGFSASENGGGWCGTGIDHSIVVGEDGVGRFRFDAVRRGAFEVFVSRPAVVTTTELAGGDLSLDVLVLAESATEGLGFEVELDPSLSSDRFGVYLLEDGRSRWLAPFGPGELVTRETRLEPGVQWAVVSLDGEAQPAYGTDRDFLAAEDATRIAPVRLRAGWGTRVLVLDDLGRALAGAEVLVDGEPVGLTAGDGSIEVRRDAQPVRIEARLAGWGPPEGVFPPVAIEGRRTEPWHRILLARE